MTAYRPDKAALSSCLLHTAQLPDSHLCRQSVLGWEYFQQLSGQHVMQVQPANDLPKKLSLGERQAMLDGTEYVAAPGKSQGQVGRNPHEGSPLVADGSGVMKDAPHPNAAGLFISFMFSREGQELLVDKAHLRCFHPGIIEPADRVPKSRTKVLTTNPIEQDKAFEEIKAKLRQICRHVIGAGMTCATIPSSSTRAELA